jgi:hypothetical protein
MAPSHLRKGPPLTARTSTPRHLAVAALVAGAAALPAAAQAGTVKSAKLDWTQTNVFTGADPAVDHTWLGYVTGPFPSNAGGTLKPIAPATGDTVNGGSARTSTSNYTESFPAASGTYDATDGTGTIELTGGVEFLAPPPPAGHGFDITIEKPKLVLDGLTGKLYASGKRSGTPATYDATQPLFTLDLSAATVTLKADGSRVISGIAPAIATAGLAFPSGAQGYAVGDGPNRTPNTFGTFALTVKTGGGDTGPAGPAGPAGATGATGAAGRNGTNATIRTVKAVLAKAPYAGSASRKVTVYSAKSGKKLASGTLKGRVLKVTLEEKVTSLSGKVKVKVTGAKTSKTVSIPS